ncbi:Nn.00g091210.m01.CDS01 [Neocucurbitaria sp. VM-36]
MLQFLNRLLGRTQNTLPPFDFARNRFRVKKKWPPNLRELTEKQQFRFERKFKRRHKLKAVRPQWNRWIKTVQWSLISFIVVYGVFFHDFRQDPMNPRPGEQPFEGLRQKMWGLLGNFYTHTETTMKGERGARRLESKGSPQAGVRGVEEEDDASPKARS